MCDFRSCLSERCESVEKFIKKTRGEANEIRAMPGRVQIDIGAIDAVGPKEISTAFEMKNAEMSKRGIGYVAAGGSSVENYGRR